jgi:hypothetical protein
MRTRLLLLLVLALISPGCAHETTHHTSLVRASRADEPKAPFTLAIVPSKSSSDARSITLAEKQPDEFYVVLTNVSKEAQLVWEYWNSWGYQTLSFEITLSTGQKTIVSKRPEVFTVNFPSTFLISPRTGARGACSLTCSLLSRLFIIAAPVNFDVMQLLSSMKQTRNLAITCLLVMTVVAICC